MNISAKQRLWFLVTGALFLIWSMPILNGLQLHWRHASVEHGYVPVLMAVALAVLVARRVRMPSIAPSAAGVVALAFLLAVSTASIAASIQGVSQFLWPLCILALVWAVAGLRNSARIALPAMFLYFAIPFWLDVVLIFPALPTLNSMLQSLTINVVSFAVDLTGIPALLDGRFISLPFGTFEIAESCSGRSYFLVATELALFYGIAFLNRWRDRVRLLCAMTGLAVLMNWIRVFALILIGYFSDMQSTLVADHNSFGWLLFAVVLLPLFYFRLSDNDQSRSTPDQRVPGRECVRLPVGWVYSLLSALMLAGILANILFHDAVVDDVETKIVSLPILSDWNEVAEWTGKSRPAFENASSVASARLVRGGDSIAVYVAHFEHQSEGKEVMDAENAPLGKEGESNASPAVAIAVDGGQQIRFRQYTVVGGYEMRIVLYSVRVAGVAVTDRFSAKWQQVIGKLRGRTDADVLILSSICKSDCAAAQKRLHEFAEAESVTVYSSIAVEI